MPRRNGFGIALLADPTRRRIVAALALRPQRPSRLAASLSISRPALSRQLRLLEEAGLVNRHSVPGDGRGLLYTINPRRHGAMTAWLAGTEVGLEPAWRRPSQRPADDLERRGQRAAENSDSGLVHGMRNDVDVRR